MLKRLLYITKTSMTFRPLFRDQCRKLGMNCKGLQCSFGDKLDNVFLRASSFKCRVNGQVNFFQRLSSSESPIRSIQNSVFSSYLCWYDVIVKKANYSLLLQEGKREQIKEKWKSLFFPSFFPIFCPVFSAMKLVTLFWLTYFNLFLTEAFTLYSRSGILPDLQS